MKINKARAIREAELEYAVEEGMKKGIQHEKRQLAVNFLKMGNSVEQVSEATGLDIERVRMLKER